MDSFNKDLTEEQRLMKQSCRNFIDRVVAPFLREEWQREWNMDPAERLPDRILKAADDISIRTLGVPEKYGGVELNPETEICSIYSSISIIHIFFRQTHVIIDLLVMMHIIILTE